MADLFEQAGGLDGLRAVLTTFYDAVFSDMMIGFMFRGVDRQHLIEVEAELTARALGAKDVEYTGLPLKEAHARHRVLGGQFERRMVLLEEAMAAHDLPVPVREAWIAHSRAVRPLITRDAGSDCNDGDA